MCGEILLDKSKLRGASEGGDPQDERENSMEDT
jgi:hypothetical protein